MAYWQGIVVAVAVIGVFFGSFAVVAFVRNRRGPGPGDDWQDHMAMRASEFVNRHGGP